MRDLAARHGESRLLVWMGLDVRRGSRRRLAFVVCSGDGVSAPGRTAEIRAVAARISKRVRHRRPRRHVPAQPLPASQGENLSAHLLRLCDHRTALARRLSANNSPLRANVCCVGRATNPRGVPRGLLRNTPSAPRSPLLTADQHIRHSVRAAGVRRPIDLDPAARLMARSRWARLGSRLGNPVDPRGTQLDPS